jgi:putative membrane protein
MISSAVLAAAHYLALGIGLGSIYMRGRLLKSYGSGPAAQTRLSDIFLADLFWGVAAVLWMVTGLMRVFGGFEKGSEWYLHLPLFWIKMALFGLVWALEMFPMITLVRWRIRSKDPGFQPPRETAKKMAVLSQLELALVMLIPVVASLMARGIWY